MLKQVYIEISNLCNFQCDFCPVVERKKAIMSTERFEKIVREAKPVANQIALHIMGEPLLHHHLNDLIAICTAQDMPINLTTNGSLLNEENRHWIVQPIVRQINFSLQSFAGNFPEKSPEKYYANIFEFTKFAMASRPDLYINFRLWNLGSESEINLNENLISAIEKFFEVNINRSVDVSHRKSKRLKDRLYLHFDSRFEWPSPQNPDLGEKGFCHGLSSHAGILADGTVVPCCLDKEGNIPLGNITDSSLEAILNSNRATQMREGFARGELVESLCKKCSFIRRFEKTPSTRQKA